jgi:transcriptional regulator with XRE-family HTH domain
MAAIIIGGEQIKAERERRGLTQAQLARILGVTHSAVSHWESGRTEIAPLTARRVAGWLGESADDGARQPERFQRNGLTVQEWRAAAQPLSIKVSMKLIEAAADDGLDLVQLFETVGTQAVRDAIASEWKRRNAEFIQAANEELERNGLWNEKYRLW